MALLDQGGQEISVITNEVFSSSGPDVKHAFSNHLRIKNNLFKQNHIFVCRNICGLLNKILFLLWICSFSLFTPAFLPAFIAKKTKEKAMPPVAQQQRIRVALGSLPRSLDPRQATDANSMRLTDLLFDPLVRLGPDLQVQPALADKWTYKDKQYTFFISPHRFFSHGRKISKKDLLFSFEAYKKGPFASSLEVLESVKAQETKDFLILELKLKRESAKFLQADLPLFKILPHELASQADFHKKPVGTGPFQLKSQSQHQLVLARWGLGLREQNPPSEPKGSALIKEVVFKIVRDDFTRFQKMLNEELDVAQSEISFQKATHFLNKKDRFHMFRGPGLSTTYLLINFQDECLKNLTTRQILAHSIDRAKIIKYKLKGFARPAVTILNPDSEFFKPGLQNPVHSLPKAKALWKNLPIKCQQKSFSLKSSHARSAVDHGKALVLQMKKAGLKMKQESYEWGRFYSDLNAGRFQLALLKWVGVMDPDIYRVAFHSQEQAPKGRNRGFYKNTHLDKLLEKGIFTMNKVQRKAIYHEIQEIVQKDLTFIPLWHEDQVAILRKNIGKYRLSRTGDFRYLLNIKKY